jgi:hypothetical protein
MEFVKRKVERAKEFTELLAMHSVESKLEEVFKVRGMRRVCSKALQDVYA